MLVTAIEPRRRLMSALFLDGEPLLVDTQTLLQSHIKPGDELTEEALCQLLETSNRRRAQEKALNLLSYREHSKAELVKKLTAASSRQAAEGAAERMVELGLVNDERFARQYAEQLLFHKRFGRRRAAYEMAAKGLDKDLIERVLDELEPDSMEQILAVIRKKYTPLPQEEKGIRRMTNALVRLGYGYGEIRAALKEAGETLEPEDDDFAL